ncbi:MAG: HAD family phosphatase [Candidatus Gracilibacteria bacterium]|nr:HAD family phosphatase [Candidatus Gracilibacteria bacterium]
MSKLSCFIFDLDGTLVFTEDANFLAYQKALAHFGIKISRTDYHQVFGQRINELVTSLAPKLSSNQIEELKKLKSSYYAGETNLLVLNKPVASILKHAKELGIICCLATSASHDSAQTVLEYFQLEAYFDYLVFGDDVVHGKPDPECFLKCIQKFKLEPAECLIFEDSEKGLEAAKASGANYVQVIPD